jgi:hypothetical protein
MNRHEEVKRDELTPHASPNECPARQLAPFAGVCARLLTDA